MKKKKIKNSIQNSKRNPSIWRTYAKKSKVRCHFCKRRKKKKKKHILKVENWKFKMREKKLYPRLKSGLGHLGERQNLCQKIKFDVMS